MVSFIVEPGLLYPALAARKDMGNDAGLYALTHRGAERAHIVPQNDSRVPTPTNRLEAARIGIHALGRERDIDGDLTSNVLAPIHNTAVRVPDAEKFLDD